MEDRYCIIGAGYTGLAVAKAFADLGLDYDHVEATEAIGGNWSHGVYDSTHLISSRRTTEYPDHPMPADYPDFPSAAQMLAYLRGFAARFGLDRRIELGVTVTRIEPLDPAGTSGWRVELDGGRVRTYTGVVVANGHYWDAHVPTHPGEFTGKQIHSKDYRNPADLHGSRVLVVGAGNSGCDLAVEAAQTFGTAELSARRGYWFLPKYVLGVPTSELDRVSLPVPKPVQEVVLRAIIALGMGPSSRYGLPTPERGVLEDDIVVNQQLPYFLKHGRVRVRPGIERFDGPTVHFVDGTSDQYDTIVWATGFHTTFPFLPEGLLNWENGQPRLLAHTFAPGLANLYFAGLVAPRSGAGALLSESSRLLAESVALQRRLPVAVGELYRVLERPRAGILAGGPELRWQLRRGRRLIRALAALTALGAAASTALPTIPETGTTAMSVPEPVPGAWAVVTGASAGIGEQLARRLAGGGHDVLLVARRRDRLEALADELRERHGVRTEVLVCDLSDRAELELLAKELAGRTVSVLCNNAGFATFGDLLDADPARERAQVAVNVDAVHELTLAVLPGMLARDRGAVLITGSTAGHQPFPGNTTYSASKAFANTFAEALHTELAGTGVGVTLLAPGPVATEFNEVAGLDAIGGGLGVVSVSAASAAALALAGVARGQRAVVPGAVATLQTIAGRHLPRALLLPVLHRVTRVIS